MKRIYLILVVLTIAFADIYAQQFPISNQYIINKFALSPAYAGYNYNTEGFLGYRQNWVGLDGAPETQQLSVNGRLGRSQGGLGTNIMHMTSGNLSHFLFSGAYAYHVEVSRDAYLSFGVAAQYYRNQYNLSNVKSSGLDPVIYNNTDLSGSTFDAEVGVMFSYLNLQAGVVGSRLIGTKINYDAAKFGSARQITAHISYMVEMNRGDFYLEPLLLVRTTMNSPLSFDVGVTGNLRKKVWFGAAYRKGNTFALTSGFALNNKVVLNYSYETGIGGLSSVSAGSHEVSLGFLMEKTQVKRPPFTVFIGEEEAKKDKKMEKELKKRTEALEKKITECCNTDKVSDLEKRIVKLESKVKDQAVAADMEQIKQYEAPFVIRNIKFGNNSDKLFSSSHASLKKLARKMEQDPGLEMKIVGYTDNVGSKRYNIRLSKKRADAVKNYLVSQGIDPARIITDGKGPEDPKGDNNTKEGRAMNRRIEGAWKRK